MIGQDCYDYIMIGLTLRLLVNIKSTNDKEFTEDNITELIEGLEECGLEVSLSGTRSFKFGTMKEDISALEKKNSTLGAELAKRVNEECLNIERIVYAEATTKKVYVIPGRRYNTEYLMNNPDKLLKGGLFEKLSDIARSDLASSCRCMLFGEATASAFHVLRATEEVLKAYYFVHRKQKRLEKPMWGLMVEQLRTKKKNHPPATLLNSLDLIRTGYRNPTQHPEALYDIDRAQDLFGVCLDSIGKMAEEL